VTSATPRTSIPPVRIVAILVGLDGLLGILYAGFIPLLPPVANQPEPVASTAMGLVGLIAAVGLWRWQAWGRWLGIAITLWSVARSIGAIAILGGFASTGGAVPVPDPLLDVIIPLTIDAIILVVLATRGPARTLPGGSA
jgi:hypothetical protein